MELDANLNWKEHVKRVVAKISGFSFVLGTLRNITSMECVLSAYYAYVYSIIKYGIIFWGNSTNSKDVFIIQKRCVKQMTNSGYLDTCKPLFKKLKLLTITDVYIMELCLLVRTSPNIFPLKHQLHKHKTRYTQNLLIPKAHKTIFQKGPYYMAIKVYKNLPETIKREKNFNKFKNKIKSFLLDSTFYSLNEYLS